MEDADFQISGKQKSIYDTQPEDQGGVLLRTRTTDLQLADELLGTPGQYDFLPQYVKNKEDMTIIDAGANIGLFSLLIQKEYPQARLIAIEPELGNYEMLKRNVATKNNKNVLLQGGLWNKDTTLSVFARPTGEYGFTVHEDPDGEISGVCVPSLMEWYGIEHIDVFKIDIEGSEYEVFDESSKGWIDKVDMFVIETHDKFRKGCAKQVEERLQEAGFSHSKFHENDVWLKGVI